MIQTEKTPVFILAGGLGTRLSEETQLKPKPMVEIGDIPILVHVMRKYYAHGFNDFVICAGYRSWEIKDYFLNYAFRRNHLEIDHRADHQKPAVTIGNNFEQENWRVRVIDTGAETMTGGRVARAFDLVRDEGFENFAVTYGDGVCDVDLNAELQFHLKHGKVATLVGVTPNSRFGELEVDTLGKVKSFAEKPESALGCINGGFFFFKKAFRSYLDTDGGCILERRPLEQLVQDQQLMMFHHTGFWQCMDTLRDKTYLQNLWDKGQAPWIKAK